MPNSTTSIQKSFAPPVSRPSSTHHQQQDTPDFTQSTEQVDTQHHLPDTTPSLINRMMQLQRVLGNRQVSRAVKQADSQGNTGSEPKIQRLFMTEDSLYQGFLQQGNGLKDPSKKKLKSQPFWTGLLSAVRIYQLYTAQPFKRSDASTVRGLLRPIRAHADALEAYVFSKRRVFDNRDHSLLNRAGDALDDAKSEADAITAAVADQTLPDMAAPWNQVLLIARTGTPFSAVLKDSDLAADPNGGERGSPQNFSGGNTSSVTALTYNRAGRQERRVFKPNETELAAAVDGMNFDHRTAQTAVRALASSRVQDLIRVKMEAAGRQFEKIITSITLAIHKGQVGTTADLAQGREVTSQVKTGPNKGSNHTNFDLSDINMQRQLANLQLFDMITGQGDRNAGNIMIDQRRGQKTTVTGIDQDFAFSNDAKGLTETIGKTAMPKFIDRYFAEAVMAITNAEFKAALKGLPESSRMAALNRLIQIKSELVQRAGRNELLVAPGDPQYPGAPTWGDVKLSDYRYSTFMSAATDYMGQMRQDQDEAFKAAKRDPTIQPQQMTSGSQTFWVLKFGDGAFLRAREDDGSDLFALVKRAQHERRLEETGFSYRGRGGPQSNIRIGSH